MIEASNTSLIILEQILSAVTLFLFIARLYLRLQVQRRGLIWSDLLIFIAWLSYVAVVSLDIKLVQLGFYDESVTMTLDNFDVTVEQMSYAEKLSFNSNFPTYSCLYLCKLSLLTLYWDLFAVDFSHIRWLLRAAFGIVITFWVTTYLVVTLACIPTSRNWDPTDYSCQDIATDLVNIITWTLHFSSDLMIFLIPLRIVLSLNLTLDKKIGVFVTFSLGLVNLSVCLVRIVLFRAFFGQLSTTSAQTLWVLDLGVSVLITILLSLRPYLGYLTKSLNSRKERRSRQTVEIGLTSSNTARGTVTSEDMFARSESDSRLSHGELISVGKLPYIEP